MVTQTVEASYNNGKIKLMSNINVNKAKLYIIVVTDEENKPLDNKIEELEGSDDFLKNDLYKKGVELLSKI